MGKNGEDLYQNFPCQFESMGGMPTDVRGPKEIKRGCRELPRAQRSHPPGPQSRARDDDRGSQSHLGEPTDTFQEEPGDGGRFEVWSYGASRSVRFDRKSRVTYIHCKRSGWEDLRRVRQMNEPSGWYRLLRFSITLSRSTGVYIVSKLGERSNQMKQHPCVKQRRVLRTVLSTATLAILALSGGALAAVTQSGEQKNMHRVGHADLQGRSSYQPNVIQLPGWKNNRLRGPTHRTIFLVPRPVSLPNPLNGGVEEPNGTMIINVTDPANPVEMFHIPVPLPAARRKWCACAWVPSCHRVAGKVYLLRNIQGNTAVPVRSRDVTDVYNPVLASAAQHSLHA